MKTLSRRTALRGGAAVAVAAAVPSVAVADDHKLLSEITEFRKLWAEYEKLEAAGHEAWERAALQFLPKTVDPAHTDIGLEFAKLPSHAHKNFPALLRKQDDGAWDRMNELDKKARQRSIRLFAMPAYTLAGVLAKVNLADDMRGLVDESWDTHDDDCPEFWGWQVQRDLERLAGGAS